MTDNILKKHVERTEKELVAEVYPADKPYRDVEATSKSHHPGQLCQSSAVWDEFYEDAKAYFSGKDAATRGVPSRWDRKKFAWNGNFSGHYVDVMCQDGMVKCECANCKAEYARCEEIYGKDPDYANNWATELVWSRVAEWGRRLKEEGVNGIFVAPQVPQAIAAAVRYYCEDRSLLLHHSRAGRKAALENFTEQQYTDRIIQILK